MPTTWVDVAAPAPVVWDHYTDPDRWPTWGPTVSSASIDGPFVDGTRGRVVTPVGVPLPFVLTGVVPGRDWSWRVAGVPATTHHVRPTGSRTCRLGIGVPVAATPYLAVCRVGIRRLARLAEAA